jgi:hypothetical protein
MFSLRLFHILLAGAHLGQGGTMLGLVPQIKSPKGDFPIEIGGETYTYKLQWLLPFFPLLSAANHLWSAIKNDDYNQYVQKGYNPVRWGEYAISAGFMTWLLGSTAGIKNMPTLVSLALLNGVLQYNGYIIEKEKAESKDSRPNEIVAWGVFAAQWIIIMAQFFTSVRQSEGEIPDLVYSIIFVLFGLFAVFGIFSSLYKTRIDDFVKMEWGYGILSLLSKSLLTWLAYGGVVNANINIE